MKLHRRKTTRLEVDIDMPFLEKRLPPPPINVVQQAIEIQTYMRSNPDATPFSAAPKLNLPRKRISRLLTIANNLPANLITELANCNDPKTLREMHVKRLLRLAKGKTASA